VLAGMMSVRGRIQREGEVVHSVAHHLTDLWSELASVGEQNGTAVFRCRTDGAIRSATAAASVPIGAICR
jgi:hypothetical protein